MLSWKKNPHGRCITTIDAHTAGEPLRIITSGFPDLPGNTMLEKRQQARDRYDRLRCSLMWEPRGHADMYGCIFTSPVTTDGDIGVLFMHNDGFSTMCGHGIIGLVKVGIETGLLKARNPPTIKIDTPAGRVSATAHLNEERVERVSFLNVPSFLLASDLSVEIPDIGQVQCDIAFGGAFYAYVDAERLGLELVPQNHHQLVEVGMQIKQVVIKSYELKHPDGDSDLNFLYGTIFVKLLPNSEVYSRNVCIFAEGEVDRSPTGTGVSGYLAIQHAKGKLPVGKTISIESLIGTHFSGCVADTLALNGISAIVPEVTGTAYITGSHEFYLDPDDPLRDGFILR